MIALIDQARADGDSLGGVVEAVARHVPRGWASRCSTSCTPISARPCCRSRLAKASKWAAASPARALHGSEHNDIFYAEGGAIRTSQQSLRAASGRRSPTARILIVRAASNPWPPSARTRDGGPDGNPTVLKPAAVTTPACSARGAHRRSHDGPGAGRPLLRAAPLG